MSMSHQNQSNAAMDGYSQVLWEPDEKSCKNSNLSSFLYFVNQKHKLELKSWPELYNWSVQEKEAFWATLASYYDVDLKSPAFNNQKWFAGDKLNFAVEILKGLNKQLPEQDGTTEALVSYSESGQRTAVSWGELNQSVQSLAAYLLSLGLQPGDRVAGILPNQHQAVIASLAAAYIGCVWTSCSPDFGLSALQDRFGQTEPHVLIACVSYSYKGKTIDIKDKIQALAAKLPSVKNIILTNMNHSEIPIFNGKSIRFFKEILEEKNNCSPIDVSFGAPLYILYSSGTTGKPKCIVHSVGGTLLQHLKELGLHVDIKPQEKLFYFTTCGWMMWNWLLSGLGVGATLVLFDGNPLYPDAAHLFQLAEKEKINHFGASAKYYAALDQAGFNTNTMALPSLRTLLSTGSPLLPETFDYLYKNIKSDVRVASISGGTDIVSCFALGNPWLPVRRGELQAPGLGMAVEVFNSQGQPVIGQTGELVCLEPFPSQPIGFWGDTTGEKYQEAYFSHFKNIWAQGDYAVKTPYGGLIILGRSDAVLNPGGVRIGTAEIYRQVEVLSEVVDCLAAGHKIRDDEEIWLFVVLREGINLNEGLVSKIKNQIKANTSPRHVPSRIIAVPDLPRTRSGKLAEIAVKKIINSEDVDNKSALANPESLEFFKTI